MRLVTLLAVLALTLGGCGGRSTNNSGDGGTGQDAAGDGAVQQHDAALQDDASSPTGWPSPGRIACGTTTCDAATQVCCAVPGDGGVQSITYSCIGTSDTCGGSTIACDEPGDCTTGDVCCRAGGAGGGGVTCTPAASCTGTGARELCHVDGDCSGSTPACCPSAYGGYATCRASCDTGDGGTPNRDGGGYNRDGGRRDGGGFFDDGGNGDAG